MINQIIGRYSIQEEKDKNIDLIYVRLRLIIQMQVFEISEINPYLLGQNQIVTLRIA